MLKFISLLLVVACTTLTQLIDAKSQRVGELNTYDTETNTVVGDVRVDKPPDVSGAELPQTKNNEESGIA